MLTITCTFFDDPRLNDRWLISTRDDNKVAQKIPDGDWYYTPAPTTWEPVPC